ncbi:hypothetical protein ACXYTJ_06515 [Gilvimarinus sp. F26214L]|uniref:hypothetical protein n=1 Tax=Gilvimarinus sp. DZF01 TaxID=3461371 RepID=UPI0040464FDA
MKYVATIVSLALGISAPAFSQTIFSDSFESGDMGANNSGVFDWHDSVRTFLVKRDSQMGDLIVYDKTGKVEQQKGFDREWQAKDGDISMMFHYPAGEFWSEQRFSLSRPYPELWIRFWLKVPINFKHSSNSPTNNKLFALWMDQYSAKGAGPTAFWTFWHDGASGSKLAYHYSPGGYKTANAPKELKSFIRYPEDQGRWMQIVMRVKAASGASRNDGIMQFYRRWENESSFTLIHDHRQADIAIPTSGPAGWKAGYFLGWSNPAYAEDTDWLMDDVVLSTTSLLDVEGPEPEPEPEPAPQPGDPGECVSSQVPTVFMPLY